MELCPECNAQLQKEEDRHTRAIDTLEGKKSRFIGTYYLFRCGGVWLKNEYYPEGTSDVSCKEE
ncbi:MAG: hypothetical protein C0473_02285 [Cyanobacteria bacterium DS3.002]|nr:hypothetical protein [Cyanobacteria bacterium DS3.002]MBA4049641.1 hypothetical protein [Cyanobacteria bacterium DS2.008]MBA4073394.1 hypothetical protein [Cyanobacteria bacterium PR.023]